MSVQLTGRLTIAVVAVPRLRPSARSGQGSGQVSVEQRTGRAGPEGERNRING